jgi:hypothetical protein
MPKIGIKFIIINGVFNGLSPSAISPVCVCNGKLMSTQSIRNSEEQSEQKSFDDGYF